MRRSPVNSRVVPRNSTTAPASGEATRRSSVGGVDRFASELDHELIRVESTTADRVAMQALRRWRRSRRSRWTVTVSVELHAQAYVRSTGHATIVTRAARPVVRSVRILWLTVAPMEGIRTFALRRRPTATASRTCGEPTRFNVRSCRQAVARTSGQLGASSATCIRAVAQRSQPAVAEPRRISHAHLHVTLSSSTAGGRAARPPRASGRRPGPAA